MIFARLARSMRTVGTAYCHCLKVTAAGAVPPDRSNPTISSMWTDPSGWQSDNGNTFTRHPKECKPWRGKEEEVTKWGARENKKKSPRGNNSIY